MKWTKRISAVVLWFIVGILALHTARPINPIHAFPQQYPNLYELTCQSPQFALGGYTSVDLITGKLRQWVCSDQYGNVYINGTTYPYLGNGRNVIDTSYEAAGSWGQDLAACNTALAPVGGGLCDTRGLSGAQTIPVGVVMSNQTGIYWGNAQVQCTMAFTAWPCLTSNGRGNTIKTDTPGSAPTTASQLAIGSVIWSANTTATTNALVEIGGTNEGAGNAPGLLQGDVSGLLVANVNNLGPVSMGGYTPQYTGYGVDYTNMQLSSFHDFAVNGFNVDYNAGLVSGCTCYNHIKNLNGNGYGTYSFWFGSDVNFDTFEQLITNFPQSNSSYAYYVNGADGDLFLNLQCENGGAATLSSCLVVTGLGTTFNDEFLKVSVSGAFGTAWSDNSNSLANTGAGNIIEVAGHYYELGGYFPIGSNGITINSAQAVRNAMSASIGSTPLFTVNGQTGAESYLITWSLKTTSGQAGTGSVTLTLGWSDNIGARSCSSGAVLLTVNDILTGSCVTDGGILTYATTYVSTGQYDLVINVLKVS